MTKQEKEIKRLEALLKQLHSGFVYDVLLDYFNYLINTTKKDVTPHKK